jgi:hypothetical protein
MYADGRMYVPIGLDVHLTRHISSLLDGWVSWLACLLLLLSYLSSWLVSYHWYAAPAVVTCSHILSGSNEVSYASVTNVMLEAWSRDGSGLLEQVFMCLRMHHAVNAGMAVSS